MSRLVIKFPTRNRPEKFKIVFEKYVEFLSGKHDVSFVLTFDEDDESMNNEPIREWLVSMAKRVPIRWFYGFSKTKIQACNANLDDVDGDVLLLASDDMIPIQMGYDDLVFQAFSMTYPDFNGAVKFWDGYRPKEDSLMTLSVIGFPIYRRFGYIYHPEYRSVYCDNEQTEALKILGKIAACEVCIIQHQWSPQLDELHARNENAAMYAVDVATFERRKAQHFDLA